MSEYYQRQEVRSVSSSVLPIAAGSVIVAAGLVKALLNSLSAAAREAHRINSINQPATVPHIIRPSTILQRSNPAMEVSRHGLKQTEAIKVSTLLTLTNSSYLTENSSDVHQKLEVLRLASTPLEAKNAAKNLLKEIESSHRRIFLKGLTIACERASLKAGFASVETHPLSTGMIRLVATDVNGRALVTEITAPASEAPKIVTEVVGVSDGTCRQIVDIYDKALEEQGIRSAMPKRKFTGGACELAAARAFVRTPVRMSVASGRTAKTVKEDSIRRSQQLNRKSYIRQRT
jgi:hypothetical protein